MVIGNLVDDIAVQSGIVGGVYGVAQLSATASATFLTDKLTYPYFTTLATPSIDQVNAISDVILYYSEMGIGWTDVALICTTEEHGIDTSNNFIDVTNQNDITIRTFQQFLVGQTDLHVEMQEIKDSEARVIF